MDINGYCLESNGQNSTKAMDTSVQIKDNRKDNIKDNRIDKAVSESENGGNELWKNTTTSANV